MTPSVTCPHCSARLGLTRPTFLPALVKCRLCHARFYAEGEMAPVALAVRSAPMLQVTFIPATTGPVRTGRAKKPFLTTGWRRQAVGFALWAGGVSGLCALILMATR